MNKDIAPFRWHAALPQHHTAIKKLIFDILQEYGLKQGAVDNCLNDIDLLYFQKQEAITELEITERKLIAHNTLELVFAENQKP